MKKKTKRGHGGRMKGGMKLWRTISKKAKIISGGCESGKEHDEIMAGDSTGMKVKSVSEKPNQLASGISFSMAKAKKLK